MTPPRCSAKCPWISGAIRPIGSFSRMSTRESRAAYERGPSSSPAPATAVVARNSRRLTGIRLSDSKGVLFGDCDGSVDAAWLDSLGEPDTDLDAAVGRPESGRVGRHDGECQ